MQNIFARHHPLYLQYTGNQQVVWSFPVHLAGKSQDLQKNYEGSILYLNIPVKQTFSRYNASQPTEDPDARFKYFINTVVPSLTKLSKAAPTRGQGVLIFIPSYMDFVRVRNFMANSTETQHISFGSISEYTAVRDVTRARSHFSLGDMLSSCILEELIIFDGTISEE